MGLGVLGESVWVRPGPIHKQDGRVKRFPKFTSSRGFVMLTEQPPFQSSASIPVISQIPSDPSGSLPGPQSCTAGPRPGMTGLS